jgi:hypothetical protein
MNAVDAHAQPLNGQRRQQRHPQDASHHGYAAMPATGNFFMPDTQGTFTFSAEPSSMMYDGALTTLPTSATGQEPVYTPHVGSSIDSSLHPDMVNYSYPPANGYAQMQNYSLSPGSYNGNGQGMSPSHSVEHLSPEGGYMSDPSIQDLSAYTTPNFNPQHIDDTLANFTISDNDQVNAFPPFHSSMDMSQLTSGTLNIFNAQPQTLPSNVPRDLHHQLISPSATNNSSPVVGTDGPTFQPMQYTRLYETSTPPHQQTQIPHSTPIKQVQSPALTNSPGIIPTPHIRPLTRHLTSPIVRVEHYSREDSPSRSDNSRPLSKRSHGSRPSAHHLSPYPQDDSTDDDEDAREGVRLQPVVRSHERNEDGSWLASGGSGQAGLSPDDRQAMGDAWVPSLGEIVEQHAKQEKKLEVQEWLTKSEVGSEAGDVRAGPGSSNNLLVPHTGRRRAKSTNDMHQHGAQGQFGLGVQTDFIQFNDAGIPGPGVYIDERSDYDDEDDEYAEPESPPAAIDIRLSQEESSYFPPTKESVSMLGAIVRPWVDVPSQSSTQPTRYQPPTSNAAMMRFRLRAKDVESASLAATVGSRRLSESDLGSLRASPGVARLIEPEPRKSKERQRRPSFLDNILPKRTPSSNLLKRKGSMPVQQSSEMGADKSKEPVIEKPKRIGSWGRPKSPRVDTNLSNHNRDLGPPSATGLSANAGPWYHGARNVIKRTRSRSDIGKSPGLKELMTQHGGPPMPMLASPLADTEATKPSAQPSPAGDDDDEEHEAVTMDLNVRSDPIIPTYEGFRTHSRQLNPRLADYMVERITQEQMRRFKHLNAVKNRNCPSEGFCTDLGGEAKQLPPRAGNKDADAPFIGFQVTAPGGSEDDGDPLPEGVVQSAQFPSGVPLPPVKRLPAEFECPLCFKVKKFYKPSDWTKHVHEDVQPFTCTFPNCGEPKSFKRKADWVRHENERHRQLENWTCQIDDCNHTCYRKDNFVQHLVREHKIAEPRQRTGRGSNKEASQMDQGMYCCRANIFCYVSNSHLDDIWAIVERCRRDTAKQPKDEPCRFCGNICTTWKKLTVHLAKHMEQISMPILTLVEQKQLNADSIISPVVEMPETRKLSISPGKSSLDNPSRYNPNSTLAPGIDPYGQFPQDAKSEAASSVMHTYPPPQMVPYKSPQSVQVNGYANYTVNSNQTYPSQTYPGLQQAPKPHNGYLNGLQIPNQPYTNGQYGMTPVSAVQQQQTMYTDSPVDTTAFPSYYTQEPQNLTNETTAMGYDTTNGMQYQQQPAQQPGTYQAMTYLNTQHNYQYQGQ